MTLADTIIAMAAAGCSPEQMAAVARQFKEKEDEIVATKRAKDAQRQRRHRHAMSHDVTVTECDSVTKVSPSLSPSSSSPPITPLITTPPNSPPSKNARDRALFDRFWKVWPNRIGKPAAYRAFGKVAHELDAILLGVERYIRDKPPDRPWLNPATFLNQRRWEDEPAQTPCALAKPKERDLRSVPDNLLSADDYWKKRKQQREWA